MQCVDAKVNITQLGHSNFQGPQRKDGHFLLGSNHLINSAKFKCSVLSHQIRTLSHLRPLFCEKVAAICSGLKQTQLNAKRLQTKVKKFIFPLTTQHLVYYSAITFFVSTRSCCDGCQPNAILGQRMKTDLFMLVACLNV